MAIDLAVFKSEFAGAISHLRDEFATLRVGRANPLMVENISVEAYDSRTPLKQLATITVADARSLLIQPWDKSIAKDVEKSIVGANLGVGVVNEGQHLRLTVPALTEESRQELARSVGERAEKARIAIRQIRDHVKEQIIAQERDSQITEDDRYGLQEQLDEQVKIFNQQVKDLADAKRNEIMTI